MSVLFEPAVINHMSLPNRFVRSATWEAMATTDGICTSRLIDMMAKLAEGDVGLIVTGHSYVSREGQAGPWQMGIHNEATLPGLTQMAEAVRRQGGKIAVQLAHAGAVANTSLSGTEAIGPSVIQENDKAPCREMNQEDIERIVSAFGEAAARAKRSGFDAVQIHAAHGYLLSQFLSPATNHRTDLYGGTLSNRARITLEVLRSVRHSVGPDYPVLIKINSEDFVEGGFSVEEMLEFSALLEEAGVDAVELSGATGRKAASITPHASARSQKRPKPTTARPRDASSRR
jgi:2,4-dienoyl-CoA reductase-like NADH-dependent reductase (Old Yellow Enzyme family)